ncbi:MAG TPA: hypothetical protein VKZ84_07940, partial [Bacteriovoracaceae bacterium]|nr:hypothetical protein [Bacteriovoracaceae bacterium]
MIGLLIILLQTQAFASTAPGCQDLARILSSAEQDLQNSNAKSCSELDISSLLPKEITSEATTFFNDNKCSPLYQIESKIAELENQEALLLGFEKLKNQISTNQEEVSTEKNQEKIQEAAKDFAQALNTAQTIEVMLDSQIPNKDLNFLQLLAAEHPDQWATAEQLRSLTATFCQQVSDAGNLRVCSSDFAPNDQTHTELRELLRTGSLSTEEATQWKNALSIEKEDGSKYSFISMSDAIRESYTKLLNGETLSPPELESIRVLDRFRSSPQFSFARKLPAPEGNNLVQSKIKHHIESLKKRQEIEINTKMSVVASLNKELLNDGEKASCSAVQVLTELDTTCMNALASSLVRAKQTASNDQTAQLTEALNSFSRSHDYIKKLNELSAKCDENLQECAINVPLDLAKISDELSALRIIKEKIGSEQEQNMDFRNFALKKFNQNCSENIEATKSIVEECNDTLASMAPEMFKLSSSLMNISLLIDPEKIPSDDEKVKALCENEEVKKLSDQR